MSAVLLLMRLAKRPPPASGNRAGALQPEPMSARFAYPFGGSEESSSVRQAALVA
ncbi:MAG: hypothetical protein IMW90_02355 [Thermogemmatispora sp.]|uniref:hypothetical protein n=1 Tax=Thermogemmatispora sp. TaxID=1968838 RepID=UPI001A0EC285|nr:hypothetical protein [Thermogemmatispora sp.]MBE3564549.1 hypothetical protein [Thermogemmatispora sp.]